MRDIFRSDIHFSAEPEVLRFGNDIALIFMSELHQVSNISHRHLTDDSFIFGIEISVPSRGSGLLCHVSSCPDVCILAVELTWTLPSLLPMG